MVSTSGFQLILMSLIATVAFGITLFFAIRRLQDKLDPNKKPTLGTYLNELGGYLVVGIAGLIYFVWKLIA